MAAIIATRSAAYDLVGVATRRQPLGLERALFLSSSKKLSQKQLDRQLYKSIPSRTSSGSLKRSIERSRDQTGDGGVGSVIAYNLSDELKIDNIHKLLERFHDYEINECLPEDVRDEVVLMSSKRDHKDDTGACSADSKSLDDVFLFREGSIVFWGVPYSRQKRLLRSLTSFKVNPNDSELIQEEKEHMSFELSDVSEKSRLSRDTIHLATNQNVDQLKLDQFAFSHAVALSVKLGIWEGQLDEYIESVEFITANMKEGKRIPLSKGEILKKTGEILCLKHSINLGSDLLDLPDVYWDRSQQEDMFLSMFAYLNIRKRTNVINEKLNNCCELMHVLANYMNDCHHVRLEWMIIALISVEVFFELSRSLL